MFVLDWLVINGFSNKRMEIQELIKDDSKQDWWLQVLLRQSVLFVMMFL